MKKLISILTVSAIAASLAVPAFAADAAGYTLNINGKASDASVCVMVPLRSVAEQLGFKVVWNNGSVLVDDGTMHTTVTIGRDNYIVSTSVEGVIGTTAPFSLGVAPTLTGGKTYVPLELFRVLLGNDDDAITVSGSTISVKSGSSSQIANPFVSCGTLDEGAAVAGFKMAVGSIPSGYSVDYISAIKGELLQINYADGSGNEILLRKGVGSGDVSGDYNQYAESSTVSVGGVNVTLRGNSGKVSVAVWTSGGYSYAIDMTGSGLARDAVTAMAAALK